MLLVEDHPITLKGLKVVLELTKGWSKITTAVDGELAWGLFQTDTPDLALIDLDIPGCNGLDLSKRILSAKPNFPLIILTNHITTSQLYQASYIGVRGVVLKSEIVNTIANAMEKIMSGGSYLSTTIQRTAFISSMAELKPQAVDLSTLSKSELGVLRLIAAEKSSGEIAEELGRSVHTIKRHRYNIGKKLDVKSGNYGLVKFAYMYRHLLG